MEVASILRTLLAQLLADFPGSVRNTFDDLVRSRNRRQSPPSSLPMLVELICIAAKAWGHVFLVIDALDEAHDRRELLTSVSTLTSNSHISMLVTSRIESDISKAFENVPYISLNDVLGKVQDDIDLFITDELTSRPQLRRLDDALKHTIAHSLREKADGMYALVLPL